MMLTMKDKIGQESATLNDNKLQAVIEYIEFLKHRPVAYQPDMTDEEMKALYAEFAEEDRQMAEEGVSYSLKGIESEENG